MTCLLLNVRVCTVMRHAHAASGMYNCMAAPLVLLMLGPHLRLMGACSPLERLQTRRSATGGDQGRAYQPGGVL